MNIRATLLAGVLCCSAGATALADPIVLKFEGIVPQGQSTTAVGNFYNGGGGPANNFGITFSSNALGVCLNTLGTLCGNGDVHASRGGLGDPSSQNGSLFFLSGSQTFMDDPAGFTTGFSLFYTAVNQGGSLNVFSGLDGTGTLLASLSLPVTASACSSQYLSQFCPYVPVGVSFSGTAESIAFVGVQNQISFDDVTFGSAIPNPMVAPEPSTLTLLGTGVAGLISIGRRRLRRA